MRNQYREEGLISRRGDSFGADKTPLSHVIRQVIADQRRILMPLLERCKRLGGRYCQEHASYKTTTLDDGTEIKTFVNPYGLEPTLKSHVTLSPAAPGSDYIFDLLPFVIERGVLIYFNGAVRVLLSTEDLDYLNNSGDSWPWGITEHAQGVFLAPPGGTLCDTGYIAPRWLMNISIDEYNSYAQAIWTLGLSSSNVSIHISAWLNNSSFDPLPYTGLMRFCAQVKQVYSNIKDLRHKDMPEWDSKYYGIFRERDTDAETLRYWLAYIGPLGVQVIELAYHSVVNCLADGLYAGAYSGQQELNAEACVLVTLYLPEASTPIELLTDEDMDDVYGDFWHFAHGWHFSPQASGTVSEDQTAAVTCVRQFINNGVGDKYWETKAKQVEISFNELTPSATITQINSGNPRFGPNSHFWIPVGAIWTWDHSHSGTARSGLVWADYPDSGPRTLNYDGESFTYVNLTGTMVAFNKCGNGNTSKSGWYPYNGNLRAAGFCGAISEAGTFSRAEGSGSYAHTTYTETATTTEDGDFSNISSKYTATGGGGLVICESISYYGDGGDCGESCTRPDMEIQLATMEFWYEKTPIAAGGGSGCSMIITNDPTVFILSSDVSKTVGAGGSEIYENSTTGVMSAEVYSSGSQCSGCDGNYNLSTGQRSTSGIGANSSTLFKDGINEIVRAGWVPQQFDTSTPGDKSEGDFLYVTDAEIVAGSNRIALGLDRTDAEKHSDWFTWNRPKEIPTTTSTGLGVWSSYSGEVIYYPRVGGDLTDDGQDYDTTILPQAQRIRHLL